MSLLFDPNQELRLAELREQLRRGRTITPDLMADVIARACLRFHAHAPSAKARLIRLVESGAFTDATLALLELELPQWKLRRLVHDEASGTVHSRSSSHFPPSSTRWPKPTTKFCHWRS